jgi:threonine dehydrogenase-like Zn-dependent dehydrogenase
MSQNPSFVLRAVRDVAFEDRPVPSLRGPKDVRVHIAQTGICGSDVRSLLHYTYERPLQPLTLR